MHRGITCTPLLAQWTALDVLPLVVASNGLPPWRLAGSADSAAARLTPARSCDTCAFHALAGRGQRVDHRDRIVVDERQQSARRSLRTAPLLFPVLQRANRDAEGVREVSLRVRSLSSPRRVEPSGLAYRSAGPRCPGRCQLFSTASRKNASLLTFV